MFQLIKRNEYNDTAILKTADDVNELIKMAKQLVNDDNMENALTLDEKMKNIESVFVECTDVDGNFVDNFVYAGRGGRGEHFGYVTSNDKSGKLVATNVSLDDTSYIFRFFVGFDSRSKQDVFAVNSKGVTLKSLDDQTLLDKTFYYILKSK